MSTTVYAPSPKEINDRYMAYLNGEGEERDPLKPFDQTKAERDYYAMVCDAIAEVMLQRPKHPSTKRFRRLLAELSVHEPGTVIFPDCPEDRQQQIVGCMRNYPVFGQWVRDLVKEWVAKGWDALHTHNTSAETDGQSS